MNWRSWWIYLVRERMGYFRPSEMTPTDLHLREDAQRRLTELTLIARKHVEAAEGPWTRGVDR